MKTLYTLYNFIDGRSNSLDDISALGYDGEDIPTELIADKDKVIYKIIKEFIKNNNVKLKGTELYDGGIRIDVYSIGVGDDILLRAESDYGKTYDLIVQTGYEGLVWGLIGKIDIALGGDQTNKARLFKYSNN